MRAPTMSVVQILSHVLLLNDSQYNIFYYTEYISVLKILKGHCEKVRQHIITECQVPNPHMLLWYTFTSDYHRSWYWIFFSFKNTVGTGC